MFPSLGTLTNHITIVHPKVERGCEDQGLAALMRSRSGQQDSKPTVLVEPPSWSGIKLGKTIIKKSLNLTSRQTSSEEKKIFQ